MPKGPNLSIAKLPVHCQPACTFDLQNRVFGAPPIFQSRSGLVEILFDSYSMATGPTAAPQTIGFIGVFQPSRLVKSPLINKPLG